MLFVINHMTDYEILMLCLVFDTNAVGVTRLKVQIILTL